MQQEVYQKLSRLLIFDLENKMIKQKAAHVHGHLFATKSTIYLTK
jgi:hypothetical protein